MAKTFPRYVSLDEYPVGTYNDQVTWLEGVIPQDANEIIVGNGPGLMPSRRQIADYLGATQLNQLTDVSDTLTPSDGQVLAYNGGAGEWSNATTSLLPAVANIGDRLTRPVSGTVATWLKRGAVDLGDYQPVGDGETDDTTAVAAAFSDADILNMPVLIPAGTFKTHTLNYRMQSVIGHNKSQCIFVGFPGEDVFHVDPTFGQFTRQAGIFTNITIRVDDSVDAATSFPQREGVGNACYAIDYPDRLAPAMPLAVDWHYLNLEFSSVAQTTDGANNSCGIYSQSNHFSQCYFNNIKIGYLWRGWWDHWPTINTTAGTTGRDHCIVDNIHFIRNRYHWRTVNWGIFDICNAIFHGGPATIGGWEMMGKLTSSTPNFHTGHITSVEMPGASGYGLKTDISVTNLLFEDVSIAGCPVDTFNGSGCEFRGFNVIPTGEPNPRWIVAGNRNRARLVGIGVTTTDDYKYNRIQDLGVGNDIKVINLQGASSSNPHRIFAVTPDGRYGHQRDSHAPLLGYLDAPFVSSDDLFVSPRSIMPGGVQGTAWDYYADSTADFGVRLSTINPVSGSMQIQNHGLNGLDSFRVGKFLPAGKVRVYIKLKTAVAGTQTWNLQAPSGTTRGTIATTPIGTSWGVIWFDADLTGVADGTAMVMNAGVISGGSGPFDVAYIMFRPWAVDWPVVNQQISADNGNAPKTLVVGVDVETQRWLVPLTAARAVTLPDKAFNGARFRIVRGAAATGAFNLNVGTGPVKALTAAGQWCHVAHDGAAWVLVAAGSL